VVYTREREAPRTRKTQYENRDSSLLYGVKRTVRHRDRQRKERVWTSDNPAKGKVDTTLIGRESSNSPKVTGTKEATWHTTQPGTLALNRWQDRRSAILESPYKLTKGRSLRSGQVMNHNQRTKRLPTDTPNEEKNLLNRRKSAIEETMGVVWSEQSRREAEPRGVDQKSTWCKKV